MKLILVVFSFAVLISGCSSFKNGGLGENASSLGKMEPYTEAYIEYAAPAGKWAGPPSLLVHLNAREPGLARITLTPNSFQNVASAHHLTDNRKPASTLELTSDVAREKIQQLAAAVETGAGTFAGCLNPVNLKLIRQDGATTETQGCRGESGWVSVASDLTAQLIELKAAERSPAPAAAVSN